MDRLLEHFIKRVEQDRLAIEGIAIETEDGYFIEHRWVPDRPRNIYSHTKSFMATAAGIAISEGKLTLDDPLVGFFPEAVPKNASPRLSRITLRSLLTMSSGFGEPLLMGVDRRAGTGAPDYIAYMLSQPVKEEPGSRFLYSTADSILAGRMVEKAVGMNLSEYLYCKIFQPLGIGLPIWECCPKGHPVGGGGMHLKLTDMMKLGRLYLNQGKWDGAPLVDPAWVREATKKQIDTPPDSIWHCGYGYQFWCSPYPQAYRADGAFGQITTVLPTAGAIVAVQCPEEGDFSKVRSALHEEILSKLTPSGQS
ncbi:MAG: serine hydrolase domain-containing protein [Oscillospiraceae bacterium]